MPGAASALSISRGVQVRRAAVFRQFMMNTPSLREERLLPANRIFEMACKLPVGLLLCFQLAMCNTQ
jgi:hypothetical protein